MIVIHLLMVLMVYSWLCIIISKVMMVMMLIAMMMIAISKVFLKSDVHQFQLLPWSDEQIRWAPLIALIGGCKKKRGGISIEICATSLSKKISTPSFAKEDIWLEARQSQSKLHSKHSDLKYLHVNLKYLKSQLSLKKVII